MMQPKLRKGLLRKQVLKRECCHQILVRIESQRHLVAQTQQKAASQLAKSNSSEITGLKLVLLFSAGFRAQT